MNLILGAILLLAPQQPSGSSPFGSVELFGTACSAASGASAEIRSRSQPYLGQALEFDVFGSAASPSPVDRISLFWGPQAQTWSNLKLPLDLAFAGMPGCFLSVGPGGHAVRSSPAAFFSWAIPADASLLGMETFIQAAVSFDTGETVTTRAIKARLGWDPLEWNGLSPALAVSRKAGVAPLSVFFDATGTVSEQEPDAFHHLTYHWDFGDPGSKRPSSSGPLAAHVFESPGLYRVRMDVAAGDGASQRALVEILVQDPDEVFSGTKTICFSNTSGFAGAPAGARLVTTSSFDSALGHYASGRRLLFRRGDRFTSSGIYIKGEGDGIIGAFGPGVGKDARGIYSNNPLVICNGTGPLNVQGSGFRIMDLQFEDPSRTVEHVFNADRRLVKSLLLRLKSTGFRVPVLISQDVIKFFGSDPHSENTIADCFTSRPRINGYYISGHQLAVLGNRVERCEVSHLVRVTYADRCVIDGNELYYPGTTRLALKLHAHQEKARYGRYSQRIVIRRNDVRASTGWIIVIGPRDDASNEELREILVERNTIVAEGVASQAIRLNCQDATIRNNVFLDRGNSGYSFRCVWVSKYGIEPSPSGIEIYHNTLHNSVSRSNAYMAEVYGHVNGPAVVKNNLVWAPRAQNSSVMAGGSAADTAGNMAAVDPRFMNPGGGDFRLQANSPAIGAGVSLPVLDDFAGNLRPWDGRGTAVGAFER